jgi:hypothetical protein
MIVGIRNKNLSSFCGCNPKGLCFSTVSHTKNVISLFPTELLVCYDVFSLQTHQREQSGPHGIPLTALPGFVFSLLPPLRSPLSFPCPLAAIPLLVTCSVIDDANKEEVEDVTEAEGAGNKDGEVCLPFVFFLCSPEAATLFISPRFVFAFFLFFILASSAALATF